MWRCTHGAAAAPARVQVKVQKPILRIPMLAIHLNRTLATDGFKPNAQNHLSPILATAVKARPDRLARAEIDCCPFTFAIMLRVRTAVSFSEFMNCIVELALSLGADDSGGAG